MKIPKRTIWRRILFAVLFGIVLFSGPVIAILLVLG